MRTEHIIQIPVHSNSIEAFLQRMDGYNVIDVTEQIAVFIEENLKNNGIKVSRSFLDYIGEIVDNAYDAFAASGNLGSKEFVLKTVIKDISNKIIVTIKDNGCGFFSQPKNIYFKREAIKEQPKNDQVYIGGANIGLTNLEKIMTQQKASLFFKNRKSSGATVRMEFSRAKEVENKNDIAQSNNLPSA